MKYLLYIFVYIFLTSTAYAFEFDCSKDVRDEAYSAMIGNKETNIPKNCFSDAMVDFFDDVLLKDIPPLTPKEVEYIDKESTDILYAAIHNYKITIEAYKEFKKKKPELDFLINKINEHHQILKNKLKITIPKIDNMISKAFGAGALGATIIGSGGGGSIMVIAKKGFEELVIKSLLDSGSSQVSNVKILNDK